MLPTGGRSAVCPRRRGIVALLAAISLAAMASTPVGAAALNALVWCDHADPALLGPFEDANGVTVNVKKFEGTGAGLAIVEQSRPGDWDVMVMDSIDGSITGRGGTISGVPTGRGGVLHTLPLLLPDLDIAVRFAYTVVTERSRRRSSRSSLRDDRVRSWPLAGPGRRRLR
jgi:spermidine/putrescine transport system substrate-binding protein